MEISKGTAERIGEAKKETNPANPPEKRVTAANRIPMSLPTPKLTVPELPGYHQHWFRGENVPRALRAGYEYVDPDEVQVEQKGIATSAEESGSTDMGTRVSIPSGGVTEGGQFERLYLMKIPQEFRDQDMAALAEVNENVARSIREGSSGDGMNPHLGGEEKNRRFLKQGQDLFYPKNRKG